MTLISSVHLSTHIVPLDITQSDGLYICGLIVGFSYTYIFFLLYTIKDFIHLEWFKHSDRHNDPQIKLFNVIPSLSIPKH